MLRNPGAAVAAVIIPSLVAKMGSGWCFTGLALLDFLSVGSAVIGRSLCPNLNVLANHGFLPPSGLNINLPTLRYAVAGACNYELSAFDGQFHEAINFNLSTSGNSSTFHLAALAKHDTIDSDGSLSRNGFVLGEKLHFDHAVWATVAKRLRLNQTSPSEKNKFGAGCQVGQPAQHKYITVEMAAKARAAQVCNAMASNEYLNASAAQMQGSPGTTALYLMTLWDFKADAAPKVWVKAFFGE
ncbi:hypothetical protein N0V88_008124 [Collariella sp. IMI 366227]|nr:hypothetical protein N0V88_008124 [Collariella sp. IMI 366227]